jgi:hypothetical protein
MASIGIVMLGGHGYGHGLLSGYGHLDVIFKWLQLGLGCWVGMDMGCWVDPIGILTAFLIMAGDNPCFCLKWLSLVWEFLKICWQTLHLAG